MTKSDSEPSVAATKRELDHATAALAEPGAGALADIEARLQLIREMVAAIAFPGYLLNVVDATLEPSISGRCAPATGDKKGLLDVSNGIQNGQATPPNPLALKWRNPATLLQRPEPQNPGAEVLDRSKGQRLAIERVVTTGRTTSPMSRPKPPEAVVGRPVFTWGWSCAQDHP